MDNESSQRDQLDRVLDSLRTDKENTPENWRELRQKREMRQQARMELIYGTVLLIVSSCGYLFIRIRLPDYYFFVLTGVTITGVFIALIAIAHRYITFLRSG